jgi:hypothetical protein
MLQLVALRVENADDGSCRVAWAAPGLGVSGDACLPKVVLQATVVTAIAGWA